VNAPSHISVSISPAGAIAAGDPSTPPLWWPAELGPVIEELSEHRYADDTESSIGNPSGWCATAATRRGWHHRHDGTFREDAYAVDATADTTVICVADGLGSSPFSRVGAEFACRAAVRALRSAFTDLPTRGDPPLPDPEAVRDGFTRILEAASREIYSLADRSGRSFKQFRTTLLAAVIVERPPIHFVACAQIGDGTMIALTRAGGIRLLGGGDSGGVGGEVTKCLPDAEDIVPGVREHLVLEPAQDLAAILLYTDGVEIPFAFRPEWVMRQLCEGVFEPAPGFKSQAQQGPILGDASPASALQRWLAFEKRGAGDDRTIAVLHRPAMVPASSTLHRIR
jgi:hypothetical protein